MSTDIGQPITVVSPRTGEVLALDAPTEDLGGYLADVREYESMLREAKNLVTAEVLQRMDREREWTVHAPGFTLSAPSDKPTKEYDALALRAELLELVDEGVLTIGAVDRAVEQEISYKAKAAGIEALHKGGGRVAAIVDAHSHEAPRRRYVKIERA